MIWAELKKILSEDYYNMARSSPVMTVDREPKILETSSGGETAVKKKPTKKTKATKKSTTKKTAKRGGNVVSRSTKKSRKVSSKGSASKKSNLVRAEGDQCFWVHEGPILSDLSDLHSALSVMTSYQFNHHTEGERNDFANWVEFVLGEQELADALRRSHSRTGCVRVVKQSLAKFNV